MCAIAQKADTLDDERHVPFVAGNGHMHATEDQEAEGGGSAAGRPAGKNLQRIPIDARIILFSSALLPPPEG
jgi:hypothetical protein